MEIGEIEKVGKKVTQIMDHIGRLIHTGLEMIDHFLATHLPLIHCSKSQTDSR